MKKISINNGASYTTPSEAIEAIGFDAIVNMMDDETREQVSERFAPCTECELVTEYLKAANEDLIIG